MIEVITYFISLAALLIGGFYLIINCNSTFNYFPSECQFCGRISKTNADRIRSMSDEELAEWFCEKLIDCIGCPVINSCRGQMVLTELIDWFKQEV